MRGEMQEGKMQEGKMQEGEMQEVRGCEGWGMGWIGGIDREVAR